MHSDVRFHYTYEFKYNIECIAYSTHTYALDVHYEKRERRSVVYDNLILGNNQNIKIKLLWKINSARLTRLQCLFGSSPHCRYITAKESSTVNPHTYCNIPHLSLYSPHTYYLYVQMKLYVPVHVHSYLSVCVCVMSDCT